VSIKKPKQYYVYIYRDIDGTELYVGKGTGRRWRCHAENHNHNNRLRNVIKKRERELQVCLYPEIIDVKNEDEAFELEIFYIQKFGRDCLKTGTLFNITDGGEGASGAVLSEEHCKKIGDRSRGRPCSEETKEKLRQANLGKTYGPETKAKLSAIHKGAIFSEERRSNISKGKKGKKFSESHIENLKKSHQGHRHSPETLEKIRQNSLDMWARKRSEIRQKSE